MSSTTEGTNARRDPRQAVLRTVLVLAAVAFAFFVAAFIWLPR